MKNEKLKGIIDAMPNDVHRMAFVTAAIYMARRSHRKLGVYPVGLLQDNETFEDWAADMCEHIHRKREPT